VEGLVCLEQRTSNPVYGMKEVVLLWVVLALRFESELLPLVTDIQCLSKLEVKWRFNSTHSKLWRDTEVSG
jgi:hypothetical protein